MRVRWLLALLLVAGCHGTNDCKHGTVLLRLYLPSDPVVDAIVITLSIGGGAAQTYPLTPTREIETIEVDFSSSKYMAGETIHVALDATAGGVPAGHTFEDTTLDNNCTVIELDLTTGSSSDMAGRDASTDMARGPIIKCSASQPCDTGACVDGYCCDSTCTDQCAACDVTGQEGHCAAVTGTPHGSRAACTGDSSGACAGACDGTLTTACSYPTVECAPPSCASGVATLAKSCSGGSCPAGAADTQTCNLGACDGNTCLTVLQASTGYSFVCAVLSNKTLRCWGDNSQGEIAQGNTATMSYLTPTSVTLSNVEQVAGTGSGACARLSDGTVSCWGGGVATPTPLAGISGVSFISGATGGQYCAIVSGGELRCWGTNTQGQLGNGVAGGVVASPVPVCDAGSSSLPCAHLTGVTWVAGGDNHTCAVYGGSSAVACWGGNEFAQLGSPADNLSHPFPSPVPGLTGTSLALGNRFSCATSGGQVKCWGSNDSARLGSNQSMTALVTPTAVCTSNDCSTTMMNANSVSTYDESACASAGGAVRCWGSNTGYQLGDGTVVASQKYAATTAVASKAASVFSAGQANFAIIADRSDRYIVGWGSDGSGELGDNSASGGPSPTPVPPKWH